MGRAVPAERGLRSSKPLAPTARHNRPPSCDTAHIGHDGGTIVSERRVAMEGNGHHEAGLGTLEAAVPSPEPDAIPLPAVVVIELDEPPQPPSIESVVATVVGAVLGAIGLAVRLFDLAIRQVVAPGAEAK